MKADVSRVTFDPQRHATSVRKQQGRVDLDADWNEQRDIDLHLRTTSIVDIVGPAGAPIDGDAFAISPNGGDLLLSAGRYYLAGTVCECDEDVSLFAQPDLPADGPFVRLGGGQWVIPPAAVPAGVYVAWLDVFQQHRSVVEDPALREVALNGPDTTTRTRTVWQVRLLRAGNPGDAVGCADLPSDWAELTAPSTGTLAAWADPTGAPPTDCAIPIGSPYRGLDNQFYRVEIHQGGAPGATTYVWSRNNGAVVVSWEATDVDTITVKSPGRDGSDGFTSGCWVELTDDRNEQLGVPGTLVQVDRAEGDSLVLRAATATGSIDHAQFSGHPRARRWDGTGTVPADGSDVPLELGISVRFASDPGATYRTYDYWSFPARAATHDIEWPEAGDKPEETLPQGPRHSHARLAVLDFDGASWTLQRDCRPLFASLVDQLTLSYVSGDTQDALPDITNAAALVALGHDLVVGVANGGRPIAGALVRFEVTGGAGRLGGAGGGAQVVVTTGADGLARTTWEVESGTVLQTATAVLLAEDGTPRGLPVAFSARLARADGIAYDPAACASLAGATTVQMAIDRLCATAGGGCETLSLVPGTDWVTALESLAEGDAAVCFQPGEYATERPVRLRGLGHIRLAGGGSTRLVASGSEEALIFEDCRSVTLQDLAVEVTGFSEPAESGLQGVVTMLDCDAVDLHRVRLTCPAGAASRTTCLTVRSEREGSAAATETVRVRDCEFVVGHAQTGVLVVNVGRVMVSGCRFTTPALPDRLDLAALLAEPTRLGKMARLLAGHLVVDRQQQVDLGGFNTAFRVHDFVVRLNSPVPEPEWQALLGAHPPTEADVSTPAGVNAYVQRVIDTATQTPASLPTFERQVKGLRSRLGSNANRFLKSVGGQASVRVLLAGAQIDVQPVAALATLTRTVNLHTAGGIVRFDSPLPQAQWEAALAASPPRDTSPSGLARHVGAVARQVLRDPVFSARVMPGLLDQLRGRNRAAAACGVRIGGQTVGDVSIEGNTWTATVEAIHVAASTRRAPGAPVSSVRSVRISGNELELSVPVEVEAAPRAVFVGNAGRALVAENHVSVAAGKALTGIHVEGALGRHVVVRDNELDNCRTGLRLVPHGAVPASHLWVVADNLAPGAAPVVDAPGVVRSTGNAG